MDFLSYSAVNENRNKIKEIMGGKGDENSSENDEIFSTGEPKSLDLSI